MICVVLIGMTIAEQLAQQKELLNRRLGLDVAGELGLTGVGPSGAADELFKEEDLIVKQETDSLSSTKQVCIFPTLARCESARCYFNAVVRS